MTFLHELYGIGTLTEPHDTEHNGDTYTTPSILRDDGKETPHPNGDHENPIP